MAHLCTDVNNASQHRREEPLREVGGECAVNINTFCARVYFKKRRSMQKETNGRAVLSAWAGLGWAPSIVVSRVQNLKTYSGL